MNGFKKCRMDFGRIKWIPKAGQDAKLVALKNRNLAILHKSK